MTYRIEINADTLSELAGKVLALAAQLNETTSATPRYVGPLTGEAEPAQEVAETAPADPTPARKSVRAAATTESQQPTEEISSTPAPVASASEPLDFDKDVAPAVLALVAAKGKPAVQEILSEYGVERASQVDDALWPELVATLRAAV